MRFDEWQDSNGVPVLDGTDLSIPSSALPAGSILQVVSTIKTNTFSTSTSNALEDVTGLSATITPSSSSSKILVHVSISGSSDSNRNGYGVLVRDSTQVAIGDAASSRPRVSFDLGVPASASGNIFHADLVPMRTVVYLDSPATTSALTYKIQVFSSTFISSNVIYVNRSSNDQNDVRGVRPVSSITLMEVAG
jgi:hypothetical protein